MKRIIIRRGGLIDFDAVQWKPLIREFTIHTGIAKLHVFNEQDTAFP